MKYKENKEINYVQIADQIRKFWKSEQIFSKSVSTREGNPTFTFYEGPPSANGTPGIHHVMARTVKDLFCRYKTIKGFKVARKGGWDTHGLPVELQVEKELGITKDDIGKKISIEEYNIKCKEAVMKFKDVWDSLTETMGFWIDLTDPYITFTKEYMETIWYLLKQFYDKGLLYKGYTIQPYSPAAGTGLSSHELNQPGTYKEVNDTSIVAQFKISGTQNEYFLAWTTTPWTLPANSALAIGEKINYVKVKTFNRYTYQPIQVILARELVSKYFDSNAGEDMDSYKPGDLIIPYQIIEEIPGKDLIGMSYEQLMPYVPLPKPAFTVVPGDFVTTVEGTGIVHISKTFGADDYRTSVQFDIPGVLVKDDQGNDVPIVDKKGRFVKQIKDFAGMYVKNYTDADESAPNYKSTDVLIAIKLKEENKAFLVEKYVHSYPHCWRTDKPILYYPLDSWFIKTTAFKDKLVELNNTINWKPKSTGTGRFGNWLENLVDWNLSRSRFWGTPLPIWVSEDRTEKKCIGSIEELTNEIEKSISAGVMEKSPYENKEVDLHRPYVDEIVLVSENGQEMYREPDLIDVWFDSGSMPYAQWHYPFENMEIFKSNFPADFIAEGVDQTRGWFFTLHTIAGLLFEEVSFKNVVSNGLVLDGEGNKMSKRLGNAVDPFQVMNKYGPDAVRWYMISNANPWENLKFDLKGVEEVQRRFFNTLQNTYSFFALYANLDNYQFESNEQNQLPFTESDNWIISKLNSLVALVDKFYADYEPTKVARAIQEFVVDDLSNWYVRLNRKRFWVGELTNDKNAAYHTLYTCLVTVAKLGSPIAPFYMDRLYKDLNDASKSEECESVHLSLIPEVSKNLINKSLEEQMRLAQNISSLVHSIRKSNKIKVRQPLNRVLIPIVDKDFKSHIQAVENLILSEVNTKTIEYIDDTSELLIKKIKPNFRKLGKEYGAGLKEITQVISEFGNQEIEELEKNGELQLELSIGKINLTLDDVEILSEDIPGWSVANEGKLTVALDINITEELRREGLSRDLVNRIQNLRKEQGLDVQDKINIMIESESEHLNNAIGLYGDYIKGETQALSMQSAKGIQSGKTLEIDGIKLKVKIELVT